MTRKETQVHASHAKWEPVRREGSIIGYHGVFKDKEHALGTARHFREAGITQKFIRDPKNPQGERMFQNDLRTVTQDYGQFHLNLHEADTSSGARDSLFTFEKFALRHGLFKDAEIVKEISGRVAEQEQRRQRIDEALQLEEARQARQKARPSRYWPQSKTAWHIRNRMEIRMAEVMHQSQDVLSTHDPEIAFQAAFYLSKKGFIDAETCHQVMDEAMQVKHHLAGGDHQESAEAISAQGFSIPIDTAQTQQFIAWMNNVEIGQAPGRDAEGSATSWRDKHSKRAGKSHDPARLF